MSFVIYIYIYFFLRRPLQHTVFLLSNFLAEFSIFIFFGNWMDLDNFMVEVDAKKFCLMNHWKGFCC